MESGDGCAAVREFQMALRELPDATGPLGALDRVTSALEASKPSAGDGAALDDAMDHIQVAIGDLHTSISQRYLQVDGVTDT